MDYQIEIRFRELLTELSKTFGEGLDLESVLFLIGVQELGKGYQKFSKRQKLELMHIGICTVLEPYGFYKTIGRDKENWPHFEFAKELPFLDDTQQKHLLKEAVLAYFQTEKNENIKNIEIPDNLRYFEK